VGVTSSPLVMIILDHLLIGVESTKSGLENFADRRRKCIGAVCISDVISGRFRGGGGVGEAKENESIGIRGVSRYSMVAFDCDSEVSPYGSCRLAFGVGGCTGCRGGQEEDLEGKGTLGKGYWYRGVDRARVPAVGSK
jgi:hypothetical protein